MKIKWRNKGLWVALGAIATLALNDAFGITPESTELYVDLALVALGAAGVISNPKEGKWFTDKETNDEGEK
jgi:uncharacterized membrane protein